MTEPKTSPSSPKILLTHFDWTLQRMEESLRNEKTDYFRDAALHRFSLTYDLALKCLQAFTAEKGQPCESWEECWQWAAANGCASDKTDWQEMGAAYSQVSQKLKGDSADSAYKKLDSYYKWMRSLYQNMLARVDS